mgnify:CR=1 FL=1
MVLRGGFKAGLWLAFILLFCFSVSVESSPRDGAEPVRSEQGRWNWELRLACQPGQRTDPGPLHRPQPPEAMKAPHVPPARASAVAELAAR